MWNSHIKTSAVLAQRRAIHKTIFQNTVHLLVGTVDNQTDSNDGDDDYKSIQENSLDVLHSLVRSIPMNRWPVKTHVLSVIEHNSLS